MAQVEFKLVASQARLHPLPILDALEVATTQQLSGSNVLGLSVSLGSLTIPGAQGHRSKPKGH